MQERISTHIGARTAEDFESAANMAKGLWFSLQGDTPGYDRIEKVHFYPSFGFDDLEPENPAEPKTCGAMSWWKKCVALRFITRGQSKAYREPAQWLFTKNGRSVLHTATGNKGLVGAISFNESRIVFAAYESFEISVQPTGILTHLYELEKPEGAVMTPIHKVWHLPDLETIKAIADSAAKPIDIWFYKTFELLIGMIPKRGSSLTMPAEYDPIASSFDHHFMFLKCDYVANSLYG
jgi:hypothetical protein